MDARSARDIGVPWLTFTDSYPTYPGTRLASAPPTPSTALMLHRAASRRIGAGIRIGIKQISATSQIVSEALCLLAFRHPEGWQSGRMRVLKSAVAFGSL